MKKANTRTKDICEQLGVPKRTFCDWVRQAKDAGTWLDIPGPVLRPAPRKKAPGTVTMNTKITKQVKLKMKRLVMANPFLTAKEFKSKVTSRLAGQWAGPARQKWRGIGKQVTDKKSRILAFKLRSVFPRYLMQIKSKCHNQTQIRKVQFKTQKMAPWVWI